LRNFNKKPSSLQLLVKDSVETTNLLDLVTGGLALIILIGGLLMLFKGISAFEDKSK
jgi:hypothetical protein